ncbi:LysR family transcriptional regulator [Devosia geojensis]|uniref:LysR family transcriptional regulator n=1 Tax=Devosia geojensis TaxID=443610 RepID=A0A0F5FVZ6_9HYPH|nr:LysR family transcriptional regulator ArgP [Devosia geojensis]KKB12740.1 LysR family transcriptional regulator [Devosia geojensis]
MMDYAHLAALSAVVRTGSFEKAAERLNVTPSAVSQRIKLLEERLGMVLVVRGQPCTATSAGQRLCRHFEEVGLLETTLAEDLGGSVPAGEPARLRIAVNADSLATWFIDAMAGAGEGLLFDLVVDDEGHSAEWLRRGEVGAAVTANAGPVQGCSVRALGALRYLAVASPGYVERWFPDGIAEDALRRAPCLVFNAKDELQARWVAGVTGRQIAMPGHWLPATQAFVDASLAGLGWGMNPEALVRRHIEEGRLVELLPGRSLDVPLHWQWSRSVEPVLKKMTAAVMTAAARWLVEPGEAIRPAPPEGAERSKGRPRRAP